MSIEMAEPSKPSSNEEELESRVRLPVADKYPAIWFKMGGGV